MTTPTAPATPVLDPASDTGISGADGVTQNTTPTLTGTATSGDTVTLLDTDGITVLGTAQANVTTGAWSIVSATLGEGIHILTATDTDTSSNTSAPSGTLSVTIDATAPTAPATPVLDPASDTGISSADGVTQNTTPTLTGTATPGDTVTLLDTDGTTALGTAQADATTGAWSIVSAALTVGAHILTATDTDTAGNVSAPSGTLSVTIDNTPVLDSASDTGVSNVDGITQNTMPTITGTATPGDTVTLLDTDGTTVLGTVQADATTGAWSIVSATLGEGTHILTVTDTDMVGNASVPSDPLSVTIDTTAPTAPATPVLDPASDTGVSGADGITQNATPTLTGTVTPGNIVTLLDTDGTTVLGTAQADATTGAWSIVPAALNEGTHTLTATDTDTAGNTSVASGPLSVTIDTTAPAAPATPVLDVASDTGVSNADGITRNTMPTITGTAAPGDAVTLLDTDGNTVLGLAQADATTGAWSIVSAVLSEGTHALTTTDMDTAGNTSAPSGILSVTIDITAPDAPATPVLDPASDSGTSSTDGITQNTTPTITGTANPGDTVTLLDTDGTTVLGTAQADATTGAWSIVSATLSEGTHALTAMNTDTDTAGNTAVASGPLSLTIDTTAPAAPATPVLDLASDTGTSNTDGITQNAMPTITGTAAPGDAVTLLDTDGNTVLGLAQADATTGAWSIGSAVLSEGSHILTVTETDTAGNISAPSGPLFVSIDTTAPTAPATPVLDPASDTGISNADGITQNATPTLTGTATPGDTITLLEGTTVLGTAQADATTGAWSIMPATLSEGSHILTVTETDTAGNISAPSGPLFVSIDTTAPTAPATPVLDPASDTGISNADGITQNATPTLTGTATPGDTITLLEGTTPLGTAQADATTGAWSIMPATLSEGTHILTVTETDTAGNISAPSDPLSLTIDNTPPEAPTTPVLDPASDTGISNADGITQNATPTLTGTAAPGDTITLLEGTTPLGTAQADATTGAWSIMSAALTLGAHILTAIDTDMAGNTSAPSSTLSVTIDNTPVLDPASDTGISNADGITRNATPTITGTVIPGDTVTLLDTDGTTVLGTAQADATTGAWSIVSAALSEGTHILTATDTDMAGNTSTPSGPLSVTIDTTAPDETATPVLNPASDTGTSNADGITRNATPTITGTATPGDTVTLLDTDGSTVLGTAQADATTGAWSIVSATLSEGTHALTTTDMDTAGNISAPSGPLSVTIDTTAPDAPAIPILDPASDTGVSNADGITRNTTPTITGTATPGDTVTLLNGAIPLGTTQADIMTGAWSIVSATLGEGTHILTAKDTDKAGNASTSGPLSVTIDTIAPTAPATPVLDPASDTGVSNADGVTRNTTPTITGTATPGDTVTLLDTYGSIVLGTTQANATTGAWSIVSAALGEGAHTLTATDTDKAGHTSAASGPRSVTIDTAAPTAPAAPVLDPASDNGFSNADGITRDTTPTLTGTAAPGDTVTLLDGTTPIGTAQADATTGAWSIMSAALGEGAHTLTVTDTDTAGNTSVLSSPLSVTIDTSVSNADGIAAFNTSTNQSIGVAARDYSGPVSDLQHEYINITSSSLNITATTPNWFLHSGSGDDALAVTSGTNVLDGGGGSNFLTGGTGFDTFFVDARGASADIWSTIVNFHAGDAVTMWGVSPADFTFDLEDNQGATGYAGVTLHATAPGHPIISVTLAGLTKAALGNGIISESFGTDPVSGSTYTNFHANA